MAFKCLEYRKLIIFNVWIDYLPMVVKIENTMK